MHGAIVWLAGFNMCHFSTLALFALFDLDYMTRGSERISLASLLSLLGVKGGRKKRETCLFKLINDILSVQEK